MLSARKNLDRAAWDAAVVANPDGGTMFQSYDFAQVKARSLWTAHVFECSGITVVVHEKAMLGLGLQWYVPKGPGVTTPEQLDAVVTDLVAEARTRRIVSLIVEPEVAPTEEFVAVLRRHGMVQIPPAQQTTSTIVVDLDRPRDEVYAALKHKHRYLRKAEREGVVVDKCTGTPEDLEQMWSLYAATAERNNLPIRPKDYFLGFWRTFLDGGTGHLFLARHEGEPLAGVFAVLLGHKSIYKDGGSVPDKTIKGVSYLLQWKVIEWMQDHGALEHDLAGSPPRDRLDDRSHPFYGLGVFKREFSDDVREYVGTWELVLRPRTMQVWRKAGLGLWRRTVGRRNGDPLFF